ncbi:glycosyl hydrolase family 28-related protein [Morganella morganii]|uniref:tail fiber/spike domain-containing protein n=1 Tax=Morganella morganii TaxID=582 RepID=UPI003EB87B3E
MTVSTELSHEEYTGNGVTTDFDFRFRIFEAKHLVVSIADTDGAERILTNGTDYTLRGVGSYRGGKVILKMPLATGWKIGIARDLPVVQETDLRNQGKFFAEVHEDAFDYLTMLIQKSLGYVSLCLRKPSFISDHYDAKGNKISNLGKPVKNGDAVDLGTMTEHISAKDKRSLRVADKDIPALPGTSVRRNKQLGFDNNGMPLLLDPAETGALGYVLMDSFEKGAVITSRYQALHWFHNGEYYRWDGDLPKSVPAGSTPESAGGVGVGKWVGVGDASLRSELSSENGASLIGIMGGRVLADKLAEFVSVRDFGAKGDGVTDDTMAFNAMLSSGCSFLYVPEGVYLINSYLRIHKNTTLVMSKNAELNYLCNTEHLFINGIAWDDDYADGYNGDGNITIIGGVLNNIRAVDKKYNTGGMGFAHAENIIISDVFFKNGYHGHFIEINSSKNVIIDNCKFFNMVAGGKDSSECINIDYAFKVGFPVMGSYDGTVCEDVTIRDCYFKACVCSAGTHSNHPDKLTHNRIKMQNCIVDGMTVEGVALRYSTDSSITNTSFINNEVGVSIESSIGTTIDGCVISNSKSIGIRTRDVLDVKTTNATVINSVIKGNPDLAIWIRECDGLNINNNTLIMNESPSVSSTEKTRNISILNNKFNGNISDSSPVIGVSGSDFIISGNTINTSGHNYGIEFYASSKRGIENSNMITKGSVGYVRFSGSEPTLSNGAMVAQIKKDKAMSFDIKSNINQGLVSIAYPSAGKNNNNINGMYFIRGNPNELNITPISTIGDNLSILTGELSGTTGPSGRMSISVSQGKLWVENRTGSEVSVGVTMNIL